MSRLAGMGLRVQTRARGGVQILRIIQGQGMKTNTFFTSSSMMKSRGVSTFSRPSFFSRPLLRRMFARRSRNYATSAPVSEQNLTLSQRLKKLSREYGWSALGVYLTLSALDFPFCFLAVRLLGTDRIGHWEHVAMGYIKKWIAVVWPQGVSYVDGAEQGGKRILEEGVRKVESVVQAEGPGKRILEEGGQSTEAGSQEEYGVIDHGYKEAEEANRKDNASKYSDFVAALRIKC